MPKQTFIVGIREMHVNLVKVTIEVKKGESEEDIEQRAIDEALEFSSENSIDIEYSHTLDKEFHTVERVP